MTGNGPVGQLRTITFLGPKAAQRMVDRGGAGDRKWTPVARTREVRAFPERPQTSG
jgi:hypothetical protein